MHKALLVITCLLLLNGCSLIAANSQDGIEEDYSKRTLGTVVEDNTIKAKLKSKIKEDKTLADANVNIKSFNKVILITGQVPDDASKQKISDFAQAIRHVKRIHNELEIGPNSSFGSRTNDSFLASKVSSRLLLTEGLKSSRIETVVENNKVYLMGLVSQEQADKAVNALQKVSGLAGIIKVFEYTSEM